MLFALLRHSRWELLISQLPCSDANKINLPMVLAIEGLTRLTTLRDMSGVLIPRRHSNLATNLSLGRAK